jgi:hypothetical protein
MLVESGNYIMEERQSIRMTADGRITKRDAAAYLGVTESCLTERHRKGLRPKSVKVCGRRFYFKSELDALIAEGGLCNIGQPIKLRAA